MTKGLPHSGCTTITWPTRSDLFNCGKDGMMHSDGDANGDGTVNGEDFTILSDELGDDEAKLEPNRITNPYTFTGRRFDPETGLYYYRARYYDARLGRFLSRDPIGFEGSKWNLYEYVGGSPGRFIDPYGESFFDWLKDIGANPVSVDTLEGLFTNPVKEVYENIHGGCLADKIRYAKSDALAQDAKSHARPDKYKHCVVSCRIARNCAVGTSLAVGILKEIFDVVGPGNAEFADLYADFSGVTNDKECPWESCEESCSADYP